MNLFDFVSKDFEYLEIDEQRLNRNDLLNEIEDYAGNFTQGVVYAFCERVSLKQVVLYLSCIYSGAIPVMVAHPSSKVSEEVFNQRLTELKKKDISNFVFDAASFEKKPGPRNYESIAFCQLSSGTTGVQKCYGITHDQLVKQALFYKEALNTNVLNVVSWLPLYHDMGLITSLFLPMIAGNKSVIIDTFKWINNPVSIFEKIDKHSGTHCWFPNFCFELLSKKDFDFKNLSNCEFINCSEPCKTSSVKKFIDKYKTKVSACYAMAENVFAVSQSKSFDEHNPLMSCGFPIKGTDVLISEEGEILIKGDCVFFNEYNNGWIKRDSNIFFETGDIGFFGEDGDLYISGRKKEMFIVNGKNVFANTIEEIVNSVNGVKSGRSVSFSLPKEGSEIIIVMYEGDRSSGPLIAKQCSGMLDVSVVVECIPSGRLIKTSSGKLCREKNKELYIKRQNVISFGRKYVLEKTGNDVGKMTGLKTEGILDSFGMMDLLFAIHKNSEKQIDWTKNYVNIDTLQDMIDECI